MKKIILIFIILIAAIFFLRFVTPEDTWIKDKSGNWVKHGNPKSPKPTNVIRDGPLKGTVPSLAKPYVRREELLGYCGLSSYGKCESDSDCHISGCSAEVCQSQNEEPIMSACVVLACHKKPKEITCGCQKKQCQWSRL